MNRDVTDHKALVTSLPPETRDALTKRSDLKGLQHLTLYLGLLALTMAGLIVQIPLWPLLLLPQGILLVFLFTLSHECTHQTPFRSKWLNEFMGHFIAPLIALPFIWFRYFHLAHHKHTNDPQNDPELEHGPRPTSRRDWLIYLSGWGYWRAMSTTLVTNAFGEITAGYLPRSRHRAMRLEARLILLTYALAALSLIFSPILLTIWLIPVLIGQPFLRAYLLAEHGLCPPVANMLENSRTTFTSRAIRALAWNMPYHAEHHSYPNVPFHHLPAFHRWTRDHLRSTSAGYMAFTSDYARSLTRQDPP